MNPVFPLFRGLPTYRCRSSLTEDDMPIKLRCAICSKLAVNAFKLPCCEQLIDDGCKWRFQACDVETSHLTLRRPFHPTVDLPSV